MSLRAQSEAAEPRHKPMRTVSHRSDAVLGAPALPAVMKAVPLLKTGGPDVLRVVDMSLPRPGRSQALVRVHAAGVNRHDINQRLRGNPNAARSNVLGNVLGLEIAGRVVMRGVGSRLYPGMRVAALVDGGGYAEYSVVDDALAFRIPDHVDDMQAAALPEALFAVRLAAFELGQLTRKQILLVHGASGGIGTMAIQLAAVSGAVPIALTRHDTHAEALKQAGAVAVLDPARDVAQQIASIAQDHDRSGVDVVLDCTGGGQAGLDLDVLAMGGRIVHLSSAQGELRLDARRLLAKSAVVTGALLRPMPIAGKAALARQIRRMVWPVVGRGIAAPIHRTFPLHAVVAAHRCMERGGHFGKIVLDIADAAPKGTAQGHWTCETR